MCQDQDQESYWFKNAHRGFNRGKWLHFWVSGKCSSPFLLLLLVFLKEFPPSFWIHLLGSSSCHVTDAWDKPRLPPTREEEIFLPFSSLPFLLLTRRKEDSCQRKNFRSCLSIKHWRWQKKKKKKLPLRNCSTINHRRKGKGNSKNPQWFQPSSLKNLGPKASNKD